MRRFALALAIVLLGAGSTAGAQTALPPAQTAQQPAPPREPAPPYQDYEVVRAYPHDPTAFTQGLVFHDGLLIESTGRIPSTVRRVRLDDGEVLERRQLDPVYFGEGLTTIGDRVFSLSWQNGTGFIWNAADLSPLGTFAYTGEGWGLTDDGTRLILSDGTPVIRFLDPETFAETGSITVTFRGRPLPQINELEWVDGQILANIWKQDGIVRIDPATGKVVGVIDLDDLMPDSDIGDPTEDVLNGIAWDETGRRLFVTGKNWPRLFEIRLIDRVRTPPPAG